MSQTFVTEVGEIKLVVTCEPHPWELVIIVLEGAMKVATGNIINSPLQQKTSEKQQQ